MALRVSMKAELGNFPDAPRAPCYSGVEKERHAVQKRMRFLAVALVFVLSAGSLSAQNWTLKDSGVGLVVQDAEYDKVLKIAERGTTFNLRKLYEEGALAGRYKGNQAFAAWLVGPHTDTYLDKNGLPIWSYRYTVTWPGGSTYSGGPAGFTSPGFAAVSLSVGNVTSGTWKIEWFIVNRDTRETRLVATDTFTTTW